MDVLENDKTLNPGGWFQRKKGSWKSATGGSVPVRMQRIGVSKTLTRFLSTAANDADDHEVANGQDP